MLVHEPDILKLITSSDQYEDQLTCSGFNDVYIFRAMENFHCRSEDLRFDDSHESRERKEESHPVSHVLDFLGKVKLAFIITKLLTQACFI